MSQSATAQPMPEKRDNPVIRFVKAVTVGQWIGLVLVILAGFFIAQNRETIAIRITTITITAPLWVVMMLSVLVGLAIGVLLHRRSRRADR